MSGRKARTVEGEGPDAGENGVGEGGSAPVAPDAAALAAQVASLRSQVRESFAKIIMAMMMLPRYRAQSIGDIQHLVLEPLLRDRIAIAHRAEAQSAAGEDMVGLAIWASVSTDADARIREQIRANVFPIRMKAEDWTSGDTLWLLDVIAPNPEATARVIANLKQVIPHGGVRLHPLITRLVDEETLRRMGATRQIDTAVPEGTMIN